MVGIVKRFDVFLITLDPTQGSEIQKTRPCLVISPDEMNKYLNTVIVAPMTTKGREYPTRVSCIFESREAQIVLDQIRTVDRTRLIKKLGTVEARVRKEVLLILQELFTE